MCVSFHDHTRWKCFLKKKRERQLVIYKSVCNIILKKEPSTVFLFVVLSFHIPPPPLCRSFVLGKTNEIVFGQGRCYTHQSTYVLNSRGYFDTTLWESLTKDINWGQSNSIWWGNYRKCRKPSRPPLSFDYCAIFFSFRTTPGFLHHFRLINL